MIATLDMCKNNEKKREKKGHHKGPHKGLGISKVNLTFGRYAFTTETGVKVHLPKPSFANHPFATLHIFLAFLSLEDAREPRQLRAGNAS